MPRKKKVDEEIENEGGLLGADSKRLIISIAIFVLAVLLGLAPFDLAGVVGATVFKGLSFVFGSGYYLLPVVLVFVAISLFKGGRPKIMSLNAIGSGLFLLSGLGLIEMIFGDNAGGYIGWGIESLGTKFFGGAMWVISIALMLISLFIIFDAKHILGLWNRLFKKKEAGEDLEEDYYEDEEEYDEEYEDEEEPEEEVEDESEEAEEEEAEEESGGLSNLLGLGKGKKKARERISLTPYNPPPLSLLQKDSGRPSPGDVKANSNIIKRTLANFGVQVEMDEVSIGPSLTRYSLKPAEGMKLSKIVGLQNELSLALAAHPIRIEAPIPGKSLVGIEVPNSSKTTVGLGSLLSSPDFKDAPDPLYMSLGKSISGKTYFANLAKMPHALIAGTTGSGKSVTIHTLVLSLLYRNSPELLRFIMVDPKRVELTLYKSIPHLLTPVITNPKKAILALKWAAKEMDRRYDILEEKSARDIQGYHEQVLEPAKDKFKKGKIDEEKLPEPMPYIVVIIDELADIMSSYPRELEAAIVRLAQMSRAVGIHLVLSTQRPSTEIITGLIKANVPTRVALQVPSQIDSRTIIDMPGAEKLLGAGDMLYLGSNMGKPVRLQSGFVTDKEIKAVVKYISEHNEGELGGEVGFSDEDLDDKVAGGSIGEAGGDDDDELYEEARMTVIELGKASTSLLQRKLRIGYARAARLIDMLEERGVIGPGEGAKPREVYESAGGDSDDLAEDFDNEDEEGAEDEYDEEEEELDEEETEEEEDENER